MRASRLIPISIVLLLALGGVAFLASSYWIHRYDELIAKTAAAHELDEKLVWSVVYEETYFREWMIGADAEIGLMQVTPTVARMWVKENGKKEFERLAAENVNELMLDPERNVQAGCWYLDKVGERYRGYPAQHALALAAYNAGPSRVVDWVSDTEIARISEEEFIEHIEIQSTKNYVSSILRRYRAVKK